MQKIKRKKSSHPTYHHHHHPTLINISINFGDRWKNGAIILFFLYRKVETFLSLRKENGIKTVKTSLSFIKYKVFFYTFS